MREGESKWMREGVHVDEGGSQYKRGRVSVCVCVDEAK